MKIIFLDIDGVLNYKGCKARSATGCLGIDEDKLLILKRIVQKTNSKIVLTSTWKTDWVKKFEGYLSPDGQYLVDRLESVGLKIYDKTIDPAWHLRGQGITDWIENSKCNVEQFVIIDDESFDFIELGLDNRFVKTNFTDGLLPEHVDKAICILNGM